MLDSTICIDNLRIRQNAVFLSLDKKTTHRDVIDEQQTNRMTDIIQKKRTALRIVKEVDRCVFSREEQ